MRAATSMALLLALSACAATDGPPARVPGTRLTEDQAMREAGRLLQGTYYGEGPYDAMNAITDRTLQTGGSTVCGPVVRPVWAFHIHHPYDGWLVLDAVSGDKVCSSLPFIR